MSSSRRSSSPANPSSPDRPAGQHWRLAALLRWLIPYRSSATVVQGITRTRNSLSALVALARAPVRHSTGRAGPWHLRSTPALNRCSLIQPLSPVVRCSHLVALTVCKLKLDNVRSDAELVEQCRRHRTESVPTHLFAGIPHSPQRRRDCIVAEWPL